jgi:hypothetical protein
MPAFADDVERGQQLFTAAGGCGCHNMADGTVGSGGREIKTPFGTFYGTNITPDRETGSVRGPTRDHRRDPHGDARAGVEAPVMPYYQFAGMSDADVRALVAYCARCRRQRQNREADVSLPFPRLAYRAWRLPSRRASPRRRRRPPNRWRAVAISSSTCRSAATATRRATASAPST